MDLFELRQTQADFRELIFDQDLSIAQIRSLMGGLNNWLYCIAVRFEAIKVELSENGTKKFNFVQDCLNVLVETSRKGLAAVAVPLSYTREYLSRWWAGACNSLPFLRKMRSRLSNVFELFSFTPGEAGTRTVPELQNFDLERSLALYEVLEQELRERAGEDGEYQTEGDRIVVAGAEDGFRDFTALPEHKGFFVVQLFNAVFEGIARYGRRDEGLGLGALVFNGDDEDEIEEQECGLVRSADDYCQPMTVNSSRPTTDFPGYAIAGDIIPERVSDRR